MKILWVEPKRLAIDACGQPETSSVLHGGKQLSYWDNMLIAAEQRTHVFSSHHLHGGKTTNTGSRWYGIRRWTKKKWVACFGCPFFRQSKIFEFLLLNLSKSDGERSYFANMNQKKNIICENLGASIPAEPVAIWKWKKKPLRKREKQTEKGTWFL